MELESPPQQAEGKLLYTAQQASGRTIKQVAHDAGMSDTRWRQIVKGSIHVQGVPVEVIAPPRTLARMAQVVGLSADQLHQVGRSDAAEVLEKAGDQPVDAGPERKLKPVNAVLPRLAGQINEQIELIYASKSMTAQEKLDAIRRVLQLQAQVEAEAGVAEASASAFNATVVTSSSHPEDN